MMELYGKAVIDERLKPRRLAEIAAYARREYGPGTGPEFLFAAMANGMPRRPRGDSPAGAFLRILGRAMRAIVPGNGNGRRSKAVEPVR